MLMIKYQQKCIQKKLLSKLQNLFASPDFVDGDLLDALTGDDGHLDLIKVHVHDDNLSIEQSNLYFHDRLHSRDILKITTIF